MSTEVTKPASRRNLLVGAAIAVAVCLLIVALLRSISAPPPPPPKTGNGPAENPVEVAREALGRDNSLATCQSALQQLTAYLTDNQKDPPALSTERREWLVKELGLSPDDARELVGSTFTPLDANHLASCLLFRDVVRGLEPAGIVTGKDGKHVRATPLEQAAAAFAFTVRQVALVEKTSRQGRQIDWPPKPLPPEYTLRRGWGTPLDRALVFLALLEQFGAADDSADKPDLVGCLVLLSDKAQAVPRIWVGVVVPDEKEMYLFDPAIGLPIPTADGKGVATLAAVRKDPSLLTRLNAPGDKAPAYDVTPGQVADADVRLVCTVSEVPPRVAMLQTELLPPAVRVGLTTNPETDRKRVEEAVVAAGGRAGAVSFWREGAGLLRHFLPESEGGGDPQRQRLDGYRREVVPDVPDFFRNAPSLEIQGRLLNLFLEPFFQSTLNPGGTRDRMLRGQVDRALGELVREDEEIRALRGSATNQADKLVKEVNDWLSKAGPLYADLERAKASGNQALVQSAQESVENLWKQARAVVTLSRLLSSDFREEEVNYLLGLCQQEKAERQQWRFDLLSRSGKEVSADEKDKRRKAWEAARDAWERYLRGNRGGPGMVAARRMLAGCLAALGQPDKAAAMYADVSGPLTPAQKAANLYLARQVKPGS